MTNHAIRIPLRLASLAAAGLLLVAAPAGVLATTNAPIAQTGGMTATLPLLGTPLSVAVTLDTVGNISGVVLGPSPALSKTKSSAEFVKFTSTDGNTSVTVKAKGGQLAIKARAKQLSDLLGDGSWSADVFGTGAKSTAGYTIGKDTSGNPTVAFGTVSPAAGITWAPSPVSPPKMNPGHAKPGVADKDKAAVATAGGTFAANGYVKRLTVSVRVAADGTASLSITLSGRDRQTLTGTLAALAGSRTWSAHLCDGTAVAVTFHVDPATGKVVYDSATGAKSTEKAVGNGFFVTFARGVGLQAGLKLNKDGTYTLVVRGQSGNCGHRHWGGIGDKGKGSGGREQGNPPMTGLTSFDRYH